MIENILNILFNIFIYPIEYLMINILDLMFNITNNYGISIILLSVIINIIILPLYYLAQKLKDNNQKILDKLQPQLNRLRDEYSKQELYFYTQALYKSNYYHPINNIKASLGLLLQIPFFIAAFHFIGNYEVFNQVSFGLINNLAKSDGLLFGLNILPFIMTSISLVLVYMYSKNMTKSERNQLLFMSFIFLVFLYSESSALLLYWSMNNLFFLIRSFIENKFNLDSFKNKAISLLTIPYYKIKENKILNFIMKDIYIQALILFFGTIFIYKAIPMAASDTGMYLVSYSMVSLSLVGFFLFFVFVAYFIYYIIPDKLKHIIAVLAVFWALSGVYYSFIIPLDLGVMNALTFPDFTIARASFNEKILSLAIVCFLIILLFMFFNKLKKTILTILVAVNFILLIQTLYFSFNPKLITDMFDKDNNIFFYKDINTNKLKQAYSFSKESNVIIILMDMFQGNIMYDILEKYPKLKKDLSGFTYYPNTLSIGSHTDLSLSSIIGGRKYIKYNNKVDDELRHESSSLENALLAKKYNHSYMRYAPLGVKCSLISSYSDGICLNKNETTFSNKNIKKMKKKYEYEYQKTISHPELTAMIFSSISFMISMPHDFKLNIFHTILVKFIHKTTHSSSLSQYLQLINMSDFANVNNDKQTFKMIHNLLSHNDWNMNKKCEFTKNTYVKYDGFFDNANCSLKLLINFFDKLKTLNIYDKTKIIVVSDHGTTNKIRAKKYPIDMPSSSALMLIKDFNSKGELSISNIFLSNMDTYGIALSGVSNNTNTALDPTKNIKKDRSLTFTNDLLNPWKVFKVKNNIFNKNNWEELNEDEIQKIMNNKNNVQK